MQNLDREFAELVKLLNSAPKKAKEKELNRTRALAIVSDIKALVAILQSESDSLNKLREIINDAPDLPDGLWSTPTLKPIELLVERDEKRKKEPLRSKRDWDKLRKKYASADAKNTERLVDLVSKAINENSKSEEALDFKGMLTKLNALIIKKRESCVNYKAKKCIPIPEDICGDCNKGDLRTTKCNRLNRSRNV